MPQLQLKPTHKVVQEYYDSLAKFKPLGIKHEGAVRSAFQTLLESCGRQFDWKLVPEFAVIPLNLDGFRFSDDYQSGKKSEIKSRVAAQFVGWEKDHALFARELEKVIRALDADAWAL